jgi:hypothetical protein
VLEAKVANPVSLSPAHARSAVKEQTPAVASFAAADFSNPDRVPPETAHDRHESNLEERKTPMAKFQFRYLSVRASRKSCIPLSKDFASNVTRRSRYLSGRALSWSSLHTLNYSFGFSAYRAGTGRNP